MIIMKVVLTRRIIFLVMALCWSQSALVGDEAVRGIRRLPGGPIELVADKNGGAVVVGVAGALQSPQQGYTAMRRIERWDALDHDFLPMANPHTVHRHALVLDDGRIVTVGDHYQVTSSLAPPEHPPIQLASTGTDGSMDLKPGIKLTPDGQFLRLFHARESGPMGAFWITGNFRCVGRHFSHGAVRLTGNLDLDLSYAQTRPLGFTVRDVVQHDDGSLSLVGIREKSNELMVGRLDSQGEFMHTRVLHRPTSIEGMEILTARSFLGGNLILGFGFSQDNQNRHVSQILMYNLDGDLVPDIAIGNPGMGVLILDAVEVPGSRLAVLQQRLNSNQQYENWLQFYSPDGTLIRESQYKWTGINSDTALAVDADRNLIAMSSLYFNSSSFEYYLDRIPVDISQEPEIILKTGEIPDLPDENHPDFTLHTKWRGDDMTFQWYRNGTAINNANKPSLNIYSDEFPLRPRGIFHLEARFQDNSITVGPYKINHGQVTELRQITMTPGMTFTASAGNLHAHLPETIFTLRKDGGILRENSTPEFVIQNFTSDETGFYEIWGTDEIGDQRYDQYFFKASATESEAIQIHRQPQSYIGPYKKYIDLSVVVSGPVQSIQWFRNGSAVPFSGERITLDGDLAQSLGDFHAIVSHGSQKVATEVATIRFDPALTFAEVTHQAVRNVGKSTTLNVKTLPPATQIELRGDGVVIQNRSSDQLSLAATFPKGNPLGILNMDLELAANPGRQNEITRNLEILPVFSLSLFPGTGPVQGNKFSIASTGFTTSPEYHFFWLKNGRRIEGAFNQRIEFENFQSSDVAIYHLGIESEAGTFLSMPVTARLPDTPAVRTLEAAVSPGNQGITITLHNYLDGDVHLETSTDLRSWKADAAIDRLIDASGSVTLPISRLNSGPHFFRASSARQ